MQKKVMLEKELGVLCPHQEASGRERDRDRDRDTERYRERHTQRDTETGRQRHWAWLEHLKPQTLSLVTQVLQQGPRLLPIHSVK